MNRHTGKFEAGAKQRDANTNQPGKQLTDLANHEAAQEITNQKHRRHAKFKWSDGPASVIREFRICVKVKVAVLGSPS